MSTLFPELFRNPLPPGIEQAKNIVSAEEEADLIRRINGSALEPFRFQQWLGKRLTRSFGWRYDFTDASLSEAEPLPDWLLPARARAAEAAGLAADTLVQALVTRYDPGAGIGWHRDRPQYGQVVGLSFGAPCRLRFRRRDGAGWARRAVDLPPGSAYRLDGAARWDWEHGIAPLAALRYSATFRTLRAPSDD